MRTYTRQTLSQRFWSKVDPGAPDECWDWKGARTGPPDSAYKYGYLGQVPASSLGPLVPIIAAHRASWLIHHGSLPSDMDVCHKCDRPICVNPNHLFLGTQADNNRDRTGKGRDGDRYHQNQRKGSGHPNARLTPEQVSEIRARYADGTKGVSQSALAEEYGVKQPQVSRIIRGVRWTTLT